MKIAVVTVHDSANFGSFLQAFALKEVLENRGHKVYFLETRNKKYVKELYYSLKLTRYAVLHPFKFVQAQLFGRKKYKLFKEAQGCFSEFDSYEVLKPDRVILGSDEIWNVRTSVFANGIFFGKNMKNVCTYAVSVGHSDAADLKKLSFAEAFIKNAPLVLARDEKTAKCVTALGGNEPEIVCDPTFLLGKEFFERPYENSYLKKHKYILLYAYEPDAKTRLILKAFAKEKNLKLVSVCFYYSWCDKSIACSPFAFCEILKNAEFVITTTFHGTIFSILNHKPFVSVPLSQKTTDILKRLGLEENESSFSNLSCAVLKKMLRTKIDYDKVEEKITHMRSHSLKLLENQIEK